MIEVGTMILPEVEVERWILLFVPLLKDTEA
jgi:hypothetical protein